MPIHIDGVAYVIIPLIGQFGYQEFNCMASQASAFIYRYMYKYWLATRPPAAAGYRSTGTSDLLDLP